MVVLCLNIVLAIRLMLVEMNIAKDSRVYILFQKCEENIERREENVKIFENVSILISRQPKRAKIILFPFLRDPNERLRSLRRVLLLLPQHRQF